MIPETRITDALADATPQRSRELASRMSKFWGDLVRFIGCSQFCPEESHERPGTLIQCANVQLRLTILSDYRKIGEVCPQRILDHREVGLADSGKFGFCRATEDGQLSALVAYLRPGSLNAFVLASDARLFRVELNLHSRELFWGSGEPWLHLADHEFSIQFCLLKVLPDLPVSQTTFDICYPLAPEQRKPACCDVGDWKEKLKGKCQQQGLSEHRPPSGVSLYSIIDSAIDWPVAQNDQGEKTPIAEYPRQYERTEERPCQAITEVLLDRFCYRSNINFVSGVRIGSGRLSCHGETFSSSRLPSREFQNPLNREFREQRVPNRTSSALTGLMAYP